MANKILELIPTMQSVELVSDNLKVKKKGIVKQGVKNIVGVNLIKINSDLIGSL